MPSSVTRLHSKYCLLIEKISCSFIVPEIKLIGCLFHSQLPSGKTKFNKSLSSTWFIVVLLIIYFLLERLRVGNRSAFSVTCWDIFLCMSYFYLYHFSGFSRFVKVISRVTMFLTTNHTFHFRLSLTKRIFWDIMCVSLETRSAISTTFQGILNKKSHDSLRKEELLVGITNSIINMRMIG